MKSNKLRILALLLALILILSACGEGKVIVQDHSEPGNTTSTTGTSGEKGGTSTVTVPEEKGDGLLVAKSEDPFNFCVKYSEDYSATWDNECGIIIYPETSGSIPYVMVWRSFDNASTAEELLRSDASGLYYEYGDAVLSVSEPTPYLIGGVSLTGAEFQYMVGEYKVTMLRLIDESPASGYVLYTAKYLDGSKNVTMDALEVAVSTFKNNKNAYEANASADDRYEIVPAFSKTVTYETYVDGDIKIDIPKGWAIEANSFDLSAAAYEIHIYDPQNPDRQVYTAIQTLWFDDKVAHDKLSSYIMAGSTFKGIPYLLGATNPIAEMFQNFSVFQASSYGTGSYMNFPDMNNWTQLESFGTTPLGGELIRGTYTNDEGVEIEGVFSGNYKKGMSLYGYKYPGVVYSPMFMTAPAEEFNEMAEVLNHIYCSLEYSQEYIDMYYAEEQSVMKTFAANTQIYNQMSEMITSSWEERQTTYDTISAKQSDATLGYDRVYNTETGEVYRVTTGFMDTYSGTLYSAIDESMYSLPISGYIY